MPQWAQFPAYRERATASASVAPELERDLRLVQPRLCPDTPHMRPTDYPVIQIGSSDEHASVHAPVGPGGRVACYHGTVY